MHKNTYNNQRCHTAKKKSTRKTMMRVDSFWGISVFLRYTPDYSEIPAILPTSAAFSLSPRA